MGRPKGSKNATSKKKEKEVAVVKEPDTAVATMEKVPEVKKNTKKAAAIRALVNDMNKELKGEGTVYTSTESFNVFRLRRPTGLLNLDMDIAGGLPAGGITEIIARDGVGKTTLANFTIAENQRIYGENSAVAYVSIEIPLDKEQARNNGVKIAYSKEELDQIEEATGLTYTEDDRKQLMSEEIGSVIESRGTTAEVSLDMALSLIESNQFQIVVIDSVAALVPEAVEEGSMQDKSYGGNAAIITQFIRKYCSIMNRRGDGGVMNMTSTIVINQARDIVGGAPMHGNPIKITGGWALKHQKLVDIEMRKVEDIIDPETKNKIGKVVGYKIIKGKAGHSEGGHGEYEYYFDTSRTNLAKAAIAAGMDETVNLIERKGPYYSYGEERFQGMEEVIEYFKDSKNREKLRADLIKAHGYTVLVGK